MILIIDNYDSFTYNIYQYVGSFDNDVSVVKNEMITNRSVINVKLDVIDCEIKKNLIIVCCKDKVIFYKFNSFTASVQKIIDKKLSFPYYTSVTWLDKFLLFNNCHFIPYILINYND